MDINYVNISAHLNGISNELQSSPTSTSMETLNSIYVIMSSIASNMNKNMKMTISDRNILSEIDNSLKSILISMFTSIECIESVWHSIFRSTCNNSSSSLSITDQKQFVYMLFNGIRNIMNYYNGKIDWFISQNQYLKNVTNGVPIHICKHISESYEEFNSDIRHSIITRVHSDKLFRKDFMKHIKNESCIDVCKQSMRLATNIIRQDKEDEFKINDCLSVFGDVYSEALIKCLDSFSIYTIIDELFIHKCQLLELIPNMIHKFPSIHITALMCSIGIVYSWLYIPHVYTINL